MEPGGSESREGQTSLSPKVKKIRDGDIILSTLLILGSAWAAYESFRMSYERYSQKVATLYTVPGLFPFIISVCILGCSIWVLQNAIRAGGDLKFLRPHTLKQTFSCFSAFIPTLVMGMMWVYVFGLVDRVPFLIATFVFTFSFMIIFKATRLFRAFLISALYSIAIVYFFARVVGTQFPKPLFF